MPKIYILRLKLYFEHGKILLLTNFWRENSTNWNFFPVKLVDFGTKIQIDFLPMIFINFHFWTRKWTLCHSVPMWYDFKLPLDNWLVHARHAKTNQLSRISDPFYPGRNSRHMGSQLAVFMTRRAFRWLAAI